MSYRNLIDVGLNVDTSELQATLERIDNNIEILTEKVGTNGEASPQVIQAIDDYVSSRDIPNEDRVSDMLATYQSDESLMDERGVDAKIQELRDEFQDDFVRDNDLPSSVEGALDDSRKFTDLEQRVEALENDLDLSNQVGTIADNLNIQENLVTGLQESVKALEKQMDLLPDVNALEDAVVTLTKSATLRKEQVESLTEQVKAQDSAIDALQDHIKALEEHVNEMHDRNETALTFFGLIKQAFALLQRGA